MFETRYFLKISFDGTDFHGWQSQPNAHSVQDEMTSALKKLLRTEVMSVLGCGRTDTGVHATEFYLHFQHLDENLEESDLVFKLNRYLPKSVAVHALKKVAPRAHARFDATSRTYHYHISRIKDPFKVNRAYHTWVPLDVANMHACAEALLHVRDFASFCKSNSGVSNTLCTVTDIGWTENGNDILFRVSANRFLRNMVRAMVGTMIEIGKGRMTKDELMEIVEAKDRRLAGESVPGHGLYLVKVNYPYPVE